MIYQSDFEKKKILADGSTNYPDFMIREYGCYFMSLLHISWGEGFKNKEQWQLIEAFYVGLRNKAIDYDCYVKNPCFDSQKFSSVKAIPMGEFTPSTYKAVIGRYRLDSMPAGKKSHFVVLDDSLNVVYDPIKEGSRHVREGALIDLRVFS